MKESWPLRKPDIYLFWSLGPVLGPTLLSPGHPERVQSATYDMIAYARQIFYTTTTNQYNRVLLQVVSNTRYVRRHFDAIGQPNTSYFPQRGVRLLGRCCINSHTYPPFLRACLQGRSTRFLTNLLSLFANQLTDRGHLFPSPLFSTHPS